MKHIPLKLNITNNSTSPNHQSACRVRLSLTAAMVLFVLFNFSDARLISAQEQTTSQPVAAPTQTARPRLEIQNPMPTPAAPAPAKRTVKPIIYTAPMSVPEASSSIDDVVPLPILAPTIFRQGLLVETANGQIITEQASDKTFNPASAIKLATALTALRSFGSTHRFTTAIWTNGTYDSATQTVNGDLFISGRDPSFSDANVIEIAREFNRLGINIVTGDLYVAPTFTMNFSASAMRSGERFYDTLDSTRRSASATRAWSNARAASGDTQFLAQVPSVAVMGAVYTATVPANARVLITHRSRTLVDVLKTMLCYSNNFMAERIGDAVGGANGVESFLITQLGINKDEIRFASTSGLGINRLTPRAMMSVYRALVAELKRHNLTMANILPVAGVDPGTLQKRYATKIGRGSIIAKTGTLGNTDGGASALVGQARAANGETLYFVIFNRGGNVSRSRSLQDEIIFGLQQQRGGPAPYAYTPHTLAMQLTNTQSNAAARDEYEANPQ